MILIVACVAAEETILVNEEKEALLCDVDNSFEFAKKGIDEADYKKTDKFGNCKCPENHLCYTSSIEKDFSKADNEETGRPEHQKLLKSLKTDFIHIVGCPVISESGYHFEMSRVSYSWRTVSAKCRYAGPPPTPWYKNIWLWASIAMLLVAVGFLYMYCRRRPVSVVRNASAARGVRGGVDSFVTNSSSTRAGPQAQA